MACSEWKVPCLPVKPWHRTLVFLFTRTLMMFSYSLNCGHCTLGRVGHVAGGDHADAAFCEHLLPEFDVGAFQTHDHRHFHAYILYRRDDALGDDVAAHDAAEDVDQHRLDVAVGEDDLERLGHHLRRSATTDIEEVGGLAAVQLDQVHGRHREAGAVDHAADVAGQRDVTDFAFFRGDFFRVDLAVVVHRGQIFMAEHCVVVDADLAVERHQVAGRGNDQRIDLGHRQVVFDEQFIETLGQLAELADLRALQLEAKG